jgi:ubiquinone/menaquinone biosynthesis C-methylase UbiE
MNDSSFQKGHTCPWWFCRAFDNPLRRLVHDPIKILSPYVNPGDRVLDLGCGMGYFTFGLAELVGDTGQVIAVDLQDKMLARVRRRAERIGWRSRVQLHLGSPEKIGVEQEVDFALAFWMVHEVRDQKMFLTETYGLLKPGGQFLIAEPKIHVTNKAFATTVARVAEIGFRASANPEIRLSRAVLFDK